MINSTIQIYNTVNGEIFTLQASPVDCISTLKPIVKELLGYPIHSQIFVIAGRRLEDESIVGAVCNESNRIYLKVIGGSFYITYRIEGQRNNTVKVPPFVTVKDFKRLVRENEERRRQGSGCFKSVCHDDLLVFHRHQSLQDTDVISERDIAREPVIHLLKRDTSSRDSRCVFIFFPNHGMLRTSFEPTDTILSLMQNVRCRYRIPDENQRLSYRGRLLESSKTFGSYGIDRDSIFSLTRTRSS